MSLVMAASGKRRYQDIFNGSPAPPSERLAKGGTNQSTKPSLGDGRRVGAVKVLSQVKNPINDRWTKRDAG